MTIKQQQFLLRAIRGYHFAFKATNNNGYRVTRDMLLNRLKMDIWGDNVIQLKVA